MTSLDPLEYRHDFPILNRKVNGKPMVYLDNTASAQTPKCVVETIEHIYYNAKPTFTAAYTASRRKPPPIWRPLASVCASLSTQSRPTK